MPREQILGHEFSGTVVEVGSELKDYRKGDRVAIQPLLRPGDDYYSVRGLGHLSEQSAFVGIRNWPWGGMGEYAVLNDYNVFKLPESVSDEQGALVEPAAVALYAVDNSGLQAGNTVLISGAGPIGALAVLSANAAGASQIFVVEPNPGRRKFVESWDYVLGCSTLSPRMCRRRSMNGQPLAWMSRLNALGTKIPWLPVSMQFDGRERLLRWDYQL
jgi:(R,R)-butanediol dehydrogenase / meso-butanediol dehydrogenase / diacetyl reductase